MTIEQPTAPRVLQRRGDDRVIGGVASGIADYFNVDPLLVRIGFVGLMVFNGLGLLFYLLGWLLIPTDTDNQSVVHRVFGGNGVGGRIAAIVLIVLGAIFVYNLFPQIEPRQGYVELGVIALVVIGIGAVLFRRPEPNAVVSADTDAAEPLTTSAPRFVVRRPSRPASPLGWYVVGAMLVGVGLLALVSGISGTSVDPGRYFGLALAILGVGLVIGTWFGRARLLILLGLALLPFAFAASLITVPIEGGWGAHRAFPTSPEELEDEYRLVGGQIYLDLTRMEDTSEPIQISASVALGELNVFVPDDAAVELEGAVGGGQMRILGEFQEGTRLETRQVAEGTGQHFVLDLEAGLGTIQVWTSRMEEQLP